MPRNRVTLADFTQPASGSTNQNNFGFSAGVLNENTSTFWQPNNVTPASTIASSALGSEYRAEATRVIFVPPLAADGTPENAEFSLTADTVDMGPFVRWSGYQPTLMAPGVEIVQVDGRLAVAVELGTPMFRVGAMQGRPNAILQGTGIKFNNSIIPVVKALDANVSGAGNPFRVIIQGYRYTLEELPSVLAGLQSVNHLSLTDQEHLGRSDFRVLDLDIPVSGALADPAKWNTLPGGPRQGSTKLYRYIQYARNAQATTVNTDFILTGDTTLGGNPSNVIDGNHDLGYSYNATNNALYVTGLGYHGVATGGVNNLKEIWLNRGKTVLEADRFEITYGASQDMNFGESLANPNLFDPIRPYPGERPLIWKESAAIGIRDVGTAVPANDLYVALTGYLIQQVS